MRYTELELIRSQLIINKPPYQIGQVIAHHPTLGAVMVVGPHEILYNDRVYCSVPAHAALPHEYEDFWLEFFADEYDPNHYEQNSYGVCCVWKKHVLAGRLSKNDAPMAHTFLEKEKFDTTPDGIKFGELILIHSGNGFVKTEKKNGPPELKYNFLSKPCPFIFIDYTQHSYKIMTADLLGNTQTSYDKSFGKNKYCIKASLYSFGVDLFHKGSIQDFYNVKYEKYTPKE